MASTRGVRVAPILWICVTAAHQPAVAQQAAAVRPLRIAVTPITHAELPADSSLLLTDEIASYVAVDNDDLTVVDPDVAAVALDESGAGAEWDRVLFTFVSTGITDDTHLAAVCDALGVDAILHFELAALIERGPWTLRGQYLLQGLRVVVRTWLFGCAVGRPLWERSKEGRIERLQDSESSGFTLAKIDATEPTRRAIGDLLDELPEFPKPDR